MRSVSVAEARRIAVRAQLLDGSATDVRSTVRAARLPPARPDRDRRAGAASRPLEPARQLRRRRARPPALGRAGVVRVERVRLADRGLPARAGADAAVASVDAVLARALGTRVPRRERPLPPVRDARARGARAASLPGARGSGSRRAAEPPVVRPASRRADAHGAPPVRRRRRRRAARRTAAVGPRRAVVPVGRDRPAARRGARARRASLPRARRPRTRGRVGGASGRGRRRGARARHRTFAVRPPRP